RRSARRSRSATAPPYLTPWPTRITGRFAASSMSTAFATPWGSAPQRQEMFALHSSGLGVSGAAASLKMSKGKSRTTGPGRPVTMVFQACPGRERHHVTSGRLEDPLAIGSDGRGEIRLVMPVGLLEGAAIELAGGHVAGDGEKRHRIEERV